MTSTDSGPSTLDLSDRYRPGGGPITLTGVQAVGRLLTEQHHADAQAGLHTGSFVSGYPGSPLGGLDIALQRASAQLSAYDIAHVPGLNEELAATAVWGSQLEVPGRQRTVDGVVGIWYGKAPGVDRAGDPIRHANVSGAHPRGGVLVIAGDDPGCKSSGIPSSCERTLASYDVPVLFPANAADIVRLGRIGIEASRASGFWVGMKITTDVADGLYSLDGSESVQRIVRPELDWDGHPWTYRQTPVLAPPASRRAEEELYGPRWEMLRRMLAANPIDIVDVDPPRPWLAIVAAGKAYADVRQSLTDLGLGDDELHRAGIRLLRLGAIHPLNRELLRRVADGCEQVLIVEEKLPFVESAVRDVLYGMPHQPTVIGALDTDGRPMVSGELSADALHGQLRRLLSDRVQLPQPRTPREQLPLLPIARTPYFCSGCPHNRSTLAPSDSLTGGGIGCHAMAAVNPHPGSEVTSITQMGGEGAHWIGQSAFLDSDDADPHMFQNMGDGTFAHSGQLAIQACVAAGVNITFKLLYNRAIAMTGGQEVAGELDVPAITRKLAAEGVARIIICADEPQRYGRRPKLADNATLWPRDRLDEAQRQLRDIPGVTVLIYDQQCAAEARRGRSRGTVPTRTTRVVINEEVCEGCGDCGAKSNCLSVQPVETEYGRKTRIEQGSCNTDYSCLDGDCPSFVTVEVPPGVAKPRRSMTDRRTPPEVPDPPSHKESGDVVLTGIGGTGVVTVNQVLAAAATLDGRHIHGLDQTGLSQKAGPVVSHLRVEAIGDGGDVRANRVGDGRASCYLALDLIVGADSANLARTDPQGTITLASTSSTPTGEQVRDVNTSAADIEALLDRVRQNVATLHSFDAAAAADMLFDDPMPAHFLLVGAAYQSGALPMSATAIEAAIEAGGVAVRANTDAFRWGRVAIADPRAFTEATSPSPSPKQPTTDIDLSPLTGETRRLAGIRAAQLIAYQDRRTAEAYVDVLRTVWAAERAVGSRTDFTEAVAHGLHQVTAYKDEYEVARMLTDPEFEARLRDDVPGGARRRYRLHPPLLRALGYHRKIALGPGWRPVLRALARGKVVRGRWLDPFRHTAVRRMERQVRDEYRALVLDLAGSLSEASYDTAVAAARAVTEIRGYESIKVAGVERYRERLAALGVTPPSGDGQS